MTAKYDLALAYAREKLNKRLADGSGTPQFNEDEVLVFVDDFIKAYEVIDRATKGTQFN